MVADIPLLFEVGMADEFDVVVLVDAPEEERLRRLVEDRGLDPEEAVRMIDAQMPAELKRARADLVVENAGTAGGAGGAGRRSVGGAGAARGGGGG